MEAEKLLHKIYRNCTKRNENRLGADFLQPGKKEGMVCDFTGMAGFTGVKMRSSFLAHCC